MSRMLHHAERQQSILTFAASRQTVRNQLLQRCCFFAWSSFAMKRKRSAAAAAVIKELRQRLGPRLLLRTCVREWYYCTEKEQYLRRKEEELKLLRLRRFFTAWLEEERAIQEDHQLQMRAEDLRRKWQMQRALMLLNQEAQDSEWAAWCELRAEDFRQQRTGAWLAKMLRAWRAIGLGRKYLRECQHKIEASVSRSRLRYAWNGLRQSVLNARRIKGALALLRKTGNEKLVRRAFEEWHLLRRYLSSLATLLTHYLSRQYQQQQIKVLRGWRQWVVEKRNRIDILDGPATALRSICQQNDQKRAYSLFTKWKKVVVYRNDIRSVVFQTLLQRSTEALLRYVTRSWAATARNRASTRRLVLQHVQMEVPQKVILPPRVIFAAAGSESSSSNSHISSKTSSSPAVSADSIPTKEEFLECSVPEEVTSSAAIFDHRVVASPKISGRVLFGTTSGSPSALPRVNAEFVTANVEDERTDKQLSIPVSTQLLFPYLEPPVAHEQDSRPPEGSSLTDVDNQVQYQLPQEFTALPLGFHSLHIEDLEEHSQRGAGENEAMVNPTKGRNEPIAPTMHRSIPRQGMELQKTSSQRISDTPKRYSSHAPFRKTHPEAFESSSSSSSGRSSQSSRLELNRGIPDRRYKSTTSTRRRVRSDSSRRTMSDGSSRSNPDDVDRSSTGSSTNRSISSVSKRIESEMNALPTAVPASPYSTTSIPGPAEVLRINGRREPGSSATSSAGSEQLLMRAWEHPRERHLLLQLHREVKEASRQ